MKTSLKRRFSLLNLLASAITLIILIALFIALSYLRQNVSVLLTQIRPAQRAHEQILLELQITEVELAHWVDNKNTNSNTTREALWRQAI